jgi:hypothetical protein
MSTNLVKLGLIWNLVNNSKFKENQKKLQLQILFQITSSSSTNFLGIFSPLAIFPWGIQILAFKFDLEKLIQRGPLVSGAEAGTGPSCHCVGLCSRVKITEHLASPFATGILSG